MLLKKEEKKKTRESKTAFHTPFSTFHSSYKILSMSWFEKCEKPALKNRQLVEIEKE